MNFSGAVPVSGFIPCKPAATPADHSVNGAMRRLMGSHHTGLDSKLHPDFGKLDASLMPYTAEVKKAYWATEYLREKTAARRGAHMPDSHFNAEQLSMGARHETEHTASNAVAKQIAKDHLAEIPDYYTRLSKMEREAKK